MNRYYIFILMGIMSLYGPLWAQQAPVSSDQLLQMALKESRETQDYRKAIELAERGLELSPDDTDIRTLLARLHFLTDDLPEAERQYRETLKLNRDHAGALSGLASLLKGEGRYDEAATYYDRLLEQDQADTLALYGLASTQFEMKEYDRALATVERGLRLSPRNERFLNLKMGVLEKQHQYRAAMETAQAYMRYYPEEEERLKDYAGKLERNASRNQAGITHLQSFYDNGMPSAHVTSFHYMRTFRQKSTLTARLNYAQRQAGGGVQLEMESYINHSGNYYSYAQAGWSNQQVFPQWRLGYSLYRGFEKGWEGEAGGRLLRVQDVTLSFGTLSVGKYLGNNWLNLRGYVIHDGGNGKWHQSYIFTGRHYLNDKLDFLALIAGTGTAPDDRSRNFQYSSFSSFISQFAGLGYQKTLGELTTISLNGVWNNYQTGEQRFLNQYDVYIGLSRRF